MNGRAIGFEAGRPLLNAAVAAMVGTGLISMAVGAHLNKRKKHHG